MELLRGTAATFALLTFALFLFPSHCEAIKCYTCEEWTQEYLDDTDGDFIERNSYKNCISDGRPESITGFPQPVERECYEFCKRQEVHGITSGKLLGVKKGCFSLPYSPSVISCLQKKLEYKSNCYRYTDEQLFREEIACRSADKRSDAANAGKLNLDDWLIKKPSTEGSSTEGQAKERKDGGRRREEMKNDVCICSTDYCNEKSQNGGSGAGISFKRTMTPGETGVMIILPAILASLRWTRLFIF